MLEPATAQEGKPGGSRLTLHEGGKPGRPAVLPGRLPDQQQPGELAGNANCQATPRAESVVPKERERRRLPFKDTTQRSRAIASLVTARSRGCTWQQGRLGNVVFLLGGWASG